VARLPSAGETFPNTSVPLSTSWSKATELSLVTAPSSVIINVPKAQQHVNALNKYLRTESSLPKKLRELAMLVTAREGDCRYI
jgi:alkylhydroperoxidase family enzyme